jgi:hypothetical protein
MDAGSCKIMTEHHDRNAHFEHPNLRFERILEGADDGSGANSADR